MEGKEQFIFLIADSDLSNLDTSAALLQELGYYNFLQAEDGVEAWAMFRNFKVDFVLSAMDMAEVNGLALLRIVRSREEYASMPFVLMAQQVTAKFVFLAGRAGVSDIIVWPFTAEIFKNKVQDILDEKTPQFQESKRTFKKGIELMKAGRNDEALKSFEKILSIHENAEVYFNMGYIKSARGEYEEALQCFRRATNINNDFARAYQKMGEMYTRLNKTDDASNCYSQAAEIYMDRKQDAEAEEVFETLTKLNPDTINVYNSLGILYRRQGRLEDAVKQYQKALRVHPDDENIHYNLSRVNQQLKNYDLAKQSLEKALEINPEFSAARESLRALEMGLTIHKQG